MVGKIKQCKIYQPTVNTNRNPPVFSAKQLNGDAAWPQGQAPLWLTSSALLCTGLLPSARVSGLPCSSAVRETLSAGFDGEEKVRSLSQRGADLIDRHLCPSP